MKVGIAIDAWKLSIFQRQLGQAGYTFTESPMPLENVMLLTVVTENVEALQEVVKSALIEAHLTQGVKA